MTESELDSIVEDFRYFLSNVGRHKLLELSNSLGEAKNNKVSSDAWDLISDETGIRQSTIEGMISRKEGGLDKWIKLMAYLFDLDAKQLIAFFTEFTDKMSKSRRLSSGEMSWAKIGQKLNEDKKLFWSDAIQILEDREPGYTIKSKGK